MVIYIYIYINDYFFTQVHILVKHRVPASFKANLRVKDINDTEALPSSSGLKSDMKPARSTTDEMNGKMKASTANTKHRSKLKCKTSQTKSSVSREAVHHSGPSLRSRKKQ